MSGLPTTLRLVDEQTGTEVKLHGPVGYSTGIYCTGVRLPGAPDYRVLTQPRPGADGEIDDTYLHGASEFSCELKLLDTPGSTRHEKLQVLRRMFAPRKRPVLYAKADGWTGERRAVLRGNPIPCVIDRESHVRLKVSISASCPSGVMESADQYTAAIYPGSATAGMSLPVSLPMSFAAGSSGSTVFVQNDGDEATPPILRIFGPVDSPIASVSNSAGSAMLTFPGLNVPYGESVIVNVEERTVVTDVGVSRYRYLDPEDSTWWDLEPGENTVSFLGSNTGTTTRLEAFWRHRHL